MWAAGIVDVVDVVVDVDVIVVGADVGESSGDGDLLMGSVVSMHFAASLSTLYSTFLSLQALRALRLRRGRLCICGSGGGVGEDGSPGSSRGAVAIAASISGPCVGALIAMAGGCGCGRGR